MNTFLKSKLRTDTTDHAIDWEEVYASFLPRIFHFFCFKVGSPAIAEELTATTFEKAWASRKNYRPDRGPIHAWIYGIARKVVADFLRRPKREVALSEAIDFPDPISAEESAQQRIDFQRLSIILSHLSARERELIALKYGAELTNRDIARLVGMSETNVGTVLHRTVNKLREEWEHDHER